MSREERRAYQRMTKKQDPYALPSTGAARARQQQLERRKARRAATTVATPPGALSRRFLVWALGGGAAVGLAAFSLAWPRMPMAAYVGVGLAAAWVVAAFALRAYVARGAARR
jgi:hypothetical protein